MGGWGSAGNAAGQHWIQETFPRPMSADTILVAGGTVPNWGSAGPSYGGFDVRIFNESSSSWVSVATLPAIAGADIYKHKFKVQKSRYWRLYTMSGKWAATTEFRLEYGDPCVK